MQMLQEFDCPDVPLPPPLEGIDNAVFQAGTPLPPPLPDRPGSPAPPPPYSSLDKPPEYSTLPRDGQSTSQATRQVTGTRQARGQGTSQQRRGGVAQGILQRQGARQAQSQGTSQTIDECPAYSAPSLGSSWNSQTTSAVNDDVTTGNHGSSAVSNDVTRPNVDDCDGYSDISSVSSPTRRGPYVVPL